MLLSSINAYWKLLKNIVLIVQMENIVNVEIKISDSVVKPRMKVHLQ